MDPKDQEIADLKAKLGTATAQVSELTEASKKATADAKKATDDLRNAQKTIADKDAIIETKNKDIVGARKTYKKLSEMTQKERDDLSAQDLEAKERAEKLEADQAELAKKQADFEKSQNEATQKDKDARTERLIRKQVGNDQKYIDLVKANISRLSDSGKALTDEEIAKVVETGVNMLGSDRPDPIRGAIGGGDGEADAGGRPTGGFSDTDAGKGLAAALGLGEIKTPQTASAGPKKI